MRRRLILILLLASVPLGYWAWAEFIKDPSETIIAELRSIASLAEFSPSTQGFRHTANIARLCDYFASDVVVRVNNAIDDVGDIHGRTDLEMALRGTMKAGSGLKVQFVDIVPAVSKGNRSALVSLTVKARLVEDDEMFAEELKLTMRKSGGKWLITQVETVPTLKP